MKYDPEYNSYRFSREEIDILLKSLEFSQWNDKTLSDKDSINITVLSNSLESSKTNSVCSL